MRTSVRRQTLSPTWRDSGERLRLPLRLPRPHPSWVAATRRSGCDGDERVVLRSAAAAARPWQSGRVVLAVINHNALAKDDPLGSISLSLAELARASYDIDGDNRDDHGDLSTTPSSSSSFPNATTYRPKPPPPLTSGFPLYSICRGGRCFVRFENAPIVLHERTYGTLSGTVEVNLPHPDTGDFPIDRQARCEESGGVLGTVL